jgi:Fic family protein
VYTPVYTQSEEIAEALASINADRDSIESLPFDVEMLRSLRETARFASTHYSTRIEGNRLTQTEVVKVIAGSKVAGRGRDSTEVRNYYAAIEEVEQLSGREAILSEADIKRIHSLVMTGNNSTSEYREGQNVIRDSMSGAIVYMPPEQADVPKLMQDLVQWINTELMRGDKPAPIIAALAHYQFATIHPYFDGNGRTARLLTNLILHRAGYGLKGIYNLEEHYAEDLPGYYSALQVGPSHNYYFGRAESDVTMFVEYFVKGMAQSYATVKLRATHASRRGGIDRMAIIRTLDPRVRRLLDLFRNQGSATNAEIARHLKLSPRTTVSLSREWLLKGLVVISDPSRKNRSYRLAPEYEKALFE